MARDYFKNQGYAVEIAYGKVLWIPGKDGRRFPITKRHDYFGLWDLLVVGGGKRFFVQIGSEDTSPKRKEIMESGFPTTNDDLILGHLGGRRFIALRGPDFGGNAQRDELGRWQRTGAVEYIEVPR